jgi:hypothetical protein
MSKIRPHIEELCEVLAETGRLGPTEYNRVSLFHATSITQVRELLLTAEACADANRPVGGWMVTRSIAEIVIRMCWVGTNDDRLFWLITSQKFQNRNKAAEFRDVLMERLSALKDGPEKQNAGKTIRELIAVQDAAIAGADEVLREYERHFSETAEYWNASKKKLKKLPTLKDMARVAPETEDLYYRQYSFACWYVHAAENVIGDYVGPEVEGGDGMALYFDLPPEEVEMALSTVLSMAFMFYLALARLGFQIDKDRVGKIAKASMFLYEKG